MENIKFFYQDEININYDEHNIIEEFNCITKNLNFLFLKFPLYNLLMGWWERKANNDLINFIDNSINFKNIIELGVGTGHLFKLLIEKNPYKNIYGIDYSLNMLNTTKNYLNSKKYSKNKICIIKKIFDSYKINNNKIILIHNNCLNLKVYNNQKYDLIISSFLFDLLSPENIKKLLKIISLILKKGGKAYIATLTVDIEKRKGLSGAFFAFYYKFINEFYKLCYVSKFLKKLSHSLFNGYYTHCRPINLTKYIEEIKELKILRTKKSSIKILGIPFLPVKIIEIKKIFKNENL